jgi:hypothetical protein
MNIYKITYSLLLIIIIRNIFIFDLNMQILQEFLIPQIFVLSQIVFIRIIRSKFIVDRDIYILIIIQQYCKIKNILNI